MVKLEFEVTRRGAARIVIGLLIGLIVGYALAATVLSPNGIAPRSCLTTADLNRTDLGNISVITSQRSRFCEGLGFVSAVRWEQDAQGNVYGVPVCLRPQQ